MNQSLLWPITTCQNMPYTHSQPSCAFPVVYESQVAGLKIASVQSGCVCVCLYVCTRDSLGFLGVCTICVLCVRVCVYFPVCVYVLRALV